MLNVKNRISVRIISVILAVMVLFLSPYAQYIDAKSNVNYVKAAEIAAGAAVSGGVEWLIALLASLGLGTAAYANRENLASSFHDYMEDYAERELDIANANADACMQVYDKANDVVTSIPWNDYIDSLSSYGESAVDDLTDIYMKLCPQLLGSYKDYVSSLLNGDVFVDGFSDAISDSYGFTGYSDIQNELGQYVLSGVNTGYDSSYSADKKFYCTYSYTSDYPIFIRSSGYFYEIISSSRTRSFSAQYVLNRADGRVYTGSRSAAWYTGSEYELSNSFNIPMFDSTDDALAAYNSNDFTSALNYQKSWDSVIDNDDLPPFYRTWQQKLWEIVANAPDFGIGSYGIGDSLDWGNDLPWIGVGSLADYVAELPDIFEKLIDDILNGVYDPSLDIPDTYDDAWQKVIDDSWDDVVDKPIDVPRDKDTPAVGDKDTDKPAVGDNDTDLPNESDTDVAEEIDIPEIVPDAISDFSGISDNLKNKFPFCIPWDIYYLLTCLADTPKTPVFVLPFYIERYSIHEDLTIDMSPFESLSKISRLFFSLLYVYGLINWTVKIVSVRKEE